MIEIKDEKIKKIIEIADKHRISPTTMAHVIGVSVATYYRYIKGETTPQSQNTRNVIDKVIEQLQ